MMMKRLKNSLTVLLILVAVAAGAADARALHDRIIQSVDAQNFTEAAKLLQQMKQEHEDRYFWYGYQLLHAKALHLSGDVKSALEIYRFLAGSTRYAVFALLPIARISSAQNEIVQSIRAYQAYLRITSAKEYVTAANEALEYCYEQKRPDELLETAKLVQRVDATRRMGQLYVAKSYRLRKQDGQARSLLLTLISAKKKDDTTSRALTELHLIDGDKLSPREKLIRGKLAYQVWNLELARMYLGPIATNNMDAAYHYGRTLFLLGNFESARATFLNAMSTWPSDPLIRTVRMQLANVFVREGNHAKATDIYRELSRAGGATMQQESGKKLVYSLRAQARFNEAVNAIRPFAAAKNLTTRGENLFLRGRIFFQMGRYSDASKDFDQVLHLKPFRNHKEVLLWKALALEKLKRVSEAQSIFLSLANGHDFYSHIARGRMQLKQPELKLTNSALSNLKLCSLPNHDDEDAISQRLKAGDLIPAFLYLHLYEEAAQLLSSVPVETWRILGIDYKNRLHLYLGFVHLAVLGENFSTATYYAEVFQKALPKGSSPLGLRQDVLRVLFPWPYREEILKFSADSGVDPFVILAIMKQESKFKRYARSPAFARGLMQLIPSTASRMAAALGFQNFTPEQLYQPDININLGTRYVRQIVQEFGTAVELIAAGYNGGESNVRRWLSTSYKEEPIDFFSTIDFSETKKYVMIVRTNYEVYKRLYEAELTAARLQNKGANQN